VFSNLFSITLPNIKKYFSGIYFKKKLFSSKQTGPKGKREGSPKLIPLHKKIEDIPLVDTPREKSKNNKPRKTIIGFVRDPVGG